MEMLNHSGWPLALALIVLSMAIHAAAVVMMAFVGMRVRVRLETLGLSLSNLVAILICVNRCDGTAIGRAARNRVRDLGSGAFVAWRYRLSYGRLALFPQLDEHARWIRADATTTLADDGRSGGNRRDATVRCKHGVLFSVMQVYWSMPTTYVTPSKS